MDKAMPKEKEKNIKVRGDSKKLPSEDKGSRVKKRDDLLLVLMDLPNKTFRIIQERVS
jgi:hypothetical protein